MNIEEFKKSTRGNFSMELNSYKEKQLDRRINSFMDKQKINDYKDFLHLLKTSSDIYEAFINHLTINVSEFFRDFKKFEELEKIHIPRLLKEKKSLKIWSSACSNGAEPYSAAIILEEKAPGANCKILATDIDRNILQQAREGRYKPEALINVSEKRKKHFFYAEKGLYRINDRLKNMVHFSQHDLLQEKFKAGCDLVLCRNVCIYFTREAQDRLYKAFAESLCPGGVFFIGASEMIFNYQQFGLEKISPCFYKKKSC
ncbi:MAG: protein-glutamate O-methyltransferase CheR [Clostridiales bacterium]|nr:protein-glutamate O-methyltransferase CheR [Clostridiales bacterium]MCF8021698.1 protein-glutamate O-methyltransferase CheR [Clostridiales bacterium]